MNGSYLNNAGVFLVQTLFGLYILAVMLRFLLQWVRADFYNPLVQFLVKITNPPLLPLRRIVPGLYGIDLASVVLLLLLQCLEIFLTAALSGAYLGLPPLVVLAIAELLGLLLGVYFWAILIQAVLSWVNPSTYHPATALLYSLTEPVLRPARRILPPMGGLDLSPLVVLLALQLVRMLCVAPLRDLAATLAAGV